MGLPLAAPLFKAVVGFLGRQGVKRGIQWGVTAITAAELGTLAIESAEGLAEYKKALAEAEKILKDLAEKIKKEIDLNIDSKLEVQVLLRLQGADNQSQDTKHPKGRGAGNNTIKTAIQQKIPFRPVIGQICKIGNDSPELIIKKNPQKKKQKLDPKDLASKKKMVAAALGKAVELITDQDLDQFIMAKLKQLMAAMLTEALDYALDWKSTLKAEMAFEIRTGGGIFC